MEDYTMSSETSSMLNNAFRTSGFGWDSAKPRALSCRTRCQHIQKYRCTMSPTYPENIRKGVNCWQCSQKRGRELNPVGHTLPLLGIHWLLWKWSQAILDPPQGCRHFDSFMQHQVVSSSTLDSGDRLTTSWNLSRHAVHTGMGPNPDSQEEGLQNPAGGMCSGVPVSGKF